MSISKKFADYAIRIEPSEVFDNAIVGISKERTLIYSIHRIIQILMEQSSFTEDEAVEWADYNILPILDADRPQFKVTYAYKYEFRSRKRIKDIVAGKRGYHPKYA
jgi:hypothetical protein